MEPSLLGALLAAAVMEVAGGSPVGTAPDPSAAWDGGGHSSVVMDEQADKSAATWVKYGLLGAAAGAVVGGAMGHFAVTDEVCVDFDPGGGGCRTERYTVEGALIGSAAGAIVGALMGVREDDLGRR